MSDIPKRLKEKGYEFGFFQAIRLLENAYPERAKVGYIGPFSDECVRLKPNNSLGFAASDVQRIEYDDKSDIRDHWHIFENFLGLYGPNSASPIFIAESIVQCISDEDPLREFFDIFNHRALSLLYRVFKKSHFLTSISSDEDDSVSRILYALMGHDYTTSSDSWTIDPSKFLRYSSMLSNGSRSAAGLESIISNYFQIDNVQVVQFAPKKVKFDEFGQGRVTADGTGGALGQSLILGNTVMDITGQFAVHLTLDSFNEFLEFQPGKPKYKEIVFLTQMYVQNRLNFSLELELETKEIQPVKLSTHHPTGEMGQSSWLGQPKNEKTVVTIDTTH